MPYSLALPIGIGLAAGIALIIVFATFSSSTSHTEPLTIQLTSKLDNRTYDLSVIPMVTEKQYKLDGVTFTYLGNSTADSSQCPPADLRSVNELYKGNEIKHFRAILSNGTSVNLDTCWPLPHTPLIIQQSKTGHGVSPGLQKRWEWRWFDPDSKTTGIIQDQVYFIPGNTTFYYFAQSSNGVGLVHSNTEKIRNSSSTTNFPSKPNFIIVQKVFPFTINGVPQGDVDKVNQNPEIVKGVYNEIANDTSTLGLATIDSQSYFAARLPGNLYSMVFNGTEGTALEFADVTFTFPQYPHIPSPANPSMAVIVQFADGNEEVLYVQVQPDQQITLLSNHLHPKAGISVTEGGPILAGIKDYEGKVTLLVSTN